MTRSTSIILALCPCFLAPVASAAQTFTASAGFLASLDCQTTTTITFDNLPHNTQLFNQYAGVHFSGTARTWDAVNFGGGGTSQSPPNVLFNFGSAAIDLQLDPPVEAFGWFNPSLFDAIKVEFFGKGDVLLGSEVMPSFGAGVTFLGYIADAPIYRVRATGVPGQSNFTIFLDTMTFGNTAACVADLDDSGTVDGADLAALLGQWGGAGSADLNCSGVVDAADLAVILGAWGSCGS